MRSLALLVAAVCAAVPLHAQDLVLTNARIVDPARRTIVQGAIWIRAGRIEGVGARVPGDARGERIDLQGRWVIPALHDLHTHSWGTAAPGRVFDGRGTEHTSQRVLRAGVTSFLDLFGAEDYLFGLRARQRRDSLGGAEVLAAGPCFTATKGHCSEYGTPTRLVDSPEDARKQLADLAPKQPDVIKLVYDNRDYGPATLPTMSKATMEALVGAARERSLKTVVHVGTWQDVRDAVLAGATAVTHVPQGDTVPDDVVRLMAERKVWHIPTLVVHTELAEFLTHPEMLDSPLLVAMTSDTVRAVYRRGMAGLDERSRRWAEGQMARSATTLESVRRLHRGGVRMLTGSDGGNWGIIQGYSVHREMVRLVEAGLSPWEALAASTTSAGEFLGRRYGVGVGDQADLVVLDASPIENIANTQTVGLVVMRGKVVFRR
ncbi:MAG TPA: amidohydrolase family protein [Gemmatimonadaceae bacterium]|nr:amidohydrolase family protein [Gemmatimonadaceae bacterium]